MNVGLKRLWRRKNNMINVDKEQTVVEFGFGDVIMTSCTSNTIDGRIRGVLGMREGPMGVCGTVVKVNKQGAISNSPVVLSFNNVNSIDVLIASLERTKKLLLGGVC
jgi:hypothetical protein